MVRVYMLSNLPLFSRGVEMLLCREGGVEIVGRETEIEAALTQIKELGPDVVMLDTTLPAGDVASMAARILTAHRNMLLIAMSPDDNTISVFREEQRTVHKIQDLICAISNGTRYHDSSGASPVTEAKTRPKPD